MPGPEPEGPESEGSVVAARVVTTLIVVGPVIAIGVSIPLLWGHLVSLRDVLLAAVFYLVSAAGVTVGYHRLFAHRGFAPNRWLKIALAAAGSTAVEGSVIGWVTAHRQHHRFSDTDGDPHTPNGFGTGARARFRGLLHAHVGWLFSPPDMSCAEAADLAADRDLVRIARFWGVFAVGWLVLPFGVGWLLSGTLMGAITAFLWAGVIRMMLLHHVTWSINSLCHSFGRRPFRTRDQSTNLAVLGVLSMGESFHNLHHAYPRSARHGVLPHQLDPSAGLIRAFERLGWATDVHWPDPARVAALSGQADQLADTR
ncbi:MAG TPA: acyl-CoA desaturase [Microthrixaceae bacterium]|nr:acyl-CoA desaturase [Microthrixaceae bacterium]